MNDLADFVGINPALPLVFAFGGERINPGYHVTEVKHAAVRSLDCGRGSDQWDELVVQLLDGSPASDEEHMSGGKFLGIVNAALSSLTIQQPTELFFEFSPGNTAIRKLRIESAQSDDQQAVVTLGPEQAVCKPFQRAKLAGAQTGATTGCCGPAQTTSSCCAS